MQAKFTEKLEEVHTAYLKMAKRCQLMEQEIENSMRDNQELQENFAEKSRQKRKLDEMYDQLRSEYELAKRSAIQPANTRAQPDLFSGMPNVMDSSDPLRQVNLRRCAPSLLVLKSVPHTDYSNCSSVSALAIFVMHPATNKLSARQCFGFLEAVKMLLALHKKSK